MGENKEWLVFQSKGLLVMKRGRKKDPRKYVEMRIEQLLEDRQKEKDSFNRQWLWRIISELKYVKAIME